MQYSLYRIAIVNLLIIHTALIPGSTQSQVQKVSTPLTISQLQERASMVSEYDTSFHASLVSEDDVLQLLEKNVALAKLQLMNNSQWLGGKSRFIPPFFNTAHKSTFQPYMQKVIVPSGSSIFAWGDTHGCIHSLLRTLNQLKADHYLDDNFVIIKPNTYLVYLGDCVDRGPYGLEVLYTLMRLKTENPQNVIIIRGNHEDATINKHPQEVGFADELDFKKFTEPDKLYRLYDMWPPVAYIGSGDANKRAYFMCCHGGLEIGVTAAPLITAPDSISFMPIYRLDRADMINALPANLRTDIFRSIPVDKRRNVTIISPTKPYTLGFMWTDFLIETPRKTANYRPGRGWEYGKRLTEHLLARDGGPEKRIQFILRGHQHHGMMLDELAAHRGFYVMWDGKVATIFSAPALTTDPLCRYDSLVKIVTADVFKDWQIEHLFQPLS